MLCFIILLVLYFLYFVFLCKSLILYVSLLIYISLYIFIVYSMKYKYIALHTFLLYVILLQVRTNLENNCIVKRKKKDTKKQQLPNCSHPPTFLTVLYPHCGTVRQSEQGW